MEYNFNFNYIKRKHSNLWKRNEEFQRKQKEKDEKFLKVFNENGGSFAQTGRVLGVSRQCVFITYNRIMEKRVYQDEK